MNRREEVYTIFKEFFGEERVDMQMESILVHFPSITVTNENERSTNINHLFAKVIVCNNGTLEGTFKLNRTEYTYKDFISGYAHSHIPRIIYDTNSLKEFKTPCLGRGPIKNTCLTLNTSFDRDIWRLFCYELSQYVTVESLAGGPYIRLEEIGTNSHFSTAQPWVEEVYNFSITPNEYIPIIAVMNMFIPYVIKSKEIPFVYNNGIYTIALSPYELVITLSNLFIAWYNTLPDSEKPERVISNNACNIWEKYKCYQGRILRRNNTYRNVKDTISNLIGTNLLTFKGEIFTLTISDYNRPIEQEEETSTLLIPVLATNIAASLIKKVNYGITRNKENRARKGTSTSKIGQDTRVL